MASVYTFTPRPNVRKRDGVALNIFGVATWAVIALFFLLLLLGVFILVKEYNQLQTLSDRIQTLEKETASLKESYERLTAKEVVLKKVKPLGLHQAKEEETVWVE